MTTQRPEVMITRPFYPASMEWLEREYTTYRLFEAPDRDAMLREVGSRIQAIAGGGAVDAALFGALPALRLVAYVGVGYEQVDVASAVQRGIVVTNTPGVLNDAVADLALSLLLAAERRIVTADAFVRAGEWPAGGFPFTRHLGDLTLGIVGLGRIGLEVAHRAEAFGMTIAYHNRNPRSGVAYAYHPDLLGLAQASDILLCVVPGGSETRHLVTEDVLRALGPTGTFVNIARGSVVDEAALVRCLQEGALGAAALDVFDREPAVPQELFALDNVVLTPHIGSATHSTRKAMGDLAVQNVLALIGGRPLLSPVAECAALTPR